MTLRRLPVAIAALAVVLAACTSGGTAAPSPSAGTSPSPGASPGASSFPAASPGPSASPISGTLQARLAYAIIDALGPPWYCDPDFYPVARADEAAIALERFPEVRADPAFPIVAERLGLAAEATFTPDQQLAAYREWKRLRAVLLTPVAGGYAFDLLVGPKAGTQQGERVAGTVDASGSVRVTSRVTAGPPNCPICLARGTRIDTPAGPLAVERLRVGDPVWTFDAAGRRIGGVVIAVGSTAVPATHRVVRLVLADGRTLLASPGHPLPDGRRVGDLEPGDPVDGSSVASASLVPYAGEATFDLLASGPTGAYWADGIPLGSTLRPGS